VKAPHGTSIPGLKSFDLWVDAGTRQADHVDIAIAEPGKPVYQMHIRNIRVNGQVDRSLFDLTPPAGYTVIAAASAEARASQTPRQNALVLQAQIRQSVALTAVVLPMTGSYAQTQAASERIESYLKTLGVTPVGPPFGRFESEQSWDTGYPVPLATHVEAPFQLVSVPAAQTASVVVNGPWGKDSDARWGAFLKSVVEQGYLPAGPPMEMWSGEDAKPGTQSTEMSIPVTKAK